MSVNSTVVLPAQPSSGTVTYVPLGGDGFTAPQAAYSVQNHAVTGDAGGGNLSVTVDMDPRFVSLVSFVSFRNAQATPGDAGYRLVVSTAAGGPQIPQLLESNVLTAISGTISSSTINHTAKLQPMLLPGAGNSGRVVVQMLNVLADLLQMSALIYLFDIRVRETTGMGPLLWARGAT